MYPISEKHAAGSFLTGFICTLTIGVATVLLGGPSAAEECPACPTTKPPSEAQKQAAMTLISGNGFSCHIVNCICPYIFSEGMTVYCDNHRYAFEIENHGGKISVKSKY